MGQHSPEFAVGVQEQATIDTALDNRHKLCSHRLGICQLMALRDTCRDAAICPELRSKRTRNRWPHSVANDPLRKSSVHRSTHFARLPVEPLDRGALSQCAGCWLPGFGYSIIRFIDDILILAPTHPQLRGCRQMSTRCWGRSSLEKHPDLSWLSFQSGRANLTKQTLSNFIEKTSQLNGPQPAAL